MFSFFFFNLTKDGDIKKGRLIEMKEKLELMVNNFSNFVDWIKLIACEQMHSFRFFFV